MKRVKEEIVKFLSLLFAGLYESDGVLKILLLTLLMLLFQIIPIKCFG